MDSYRLVSAEMMVCSALKAQRVAVETGIFAADMKVALVNDGPVSIWFDTAAS